MSNEEIAVTRERLKLLEERVELLEAQNNIIVRKWGWTHKVLLIDVVYMLLRKMGLRLEHVPETPSTTVLAPIPPMTTVKVGGRWKPKKAKS